MTALRARYCRSAKLPRPASNVEETAELPVKTTALQMGKIRPRSSVDRAAVS
jgi:hypothetical protein